MRCRCICYCECSRAAHEAEPRPGDGGWPDIRHQAANGTGPCYCVTFERYEEDDAPGCEVHDEGCGRVICEEYGVRCGMDDGAGRVFCEGCP